MTKLYFILNVCLLGAGLTIHADTADALKKAGGKGTTALIAGYTATAPNMDGKIDDPVWAKSIVRDDLSTLDNHDNPQLKTTVRALFDDHNLYLGFSCAEKESEIKRVYREDGAALSLDSNINIFLRPDNIASISTMPRDDSHFQFMFNPNGARFAQTGNLGHGTLKGDWQVVTSTSPDGWQAEVKIPFISLDKRLKKIENLDFWELQICRGTFPGGKEESTTLFPASGMLNYHDAFGVLVFVKDPNGPNKKGRQLDYIRRIQPDLVKVEQALQNMKMDSNSPGFKALADFRRNWNAADGLQYFAKRKELFQQLAALRSEVNAICRQKLVDLLKKTGSRLLAVPHPAITDEGKVVPDTIPNAAMVGQPVKLRLCRNEFEPATVVLWAPEQLSDVTVSLTPVEGVDIVPNWTKCWFQSGATQNASSGCFITPELLVNNDDIVGVDLVNRKNIFREPLAVKDKWQYPPDDAAKLQPLKILPPAFAKQLWLTAHAAATARPGIYKSEIVINAGGETVARLPLQVEVLEFELLSSPMTFGCYDNTGWGKKPAVKAENEMRNLINHGINAVGLRENAEDLPKVVEMMQRAGLPTESIYIQNCVNPWIMPHCTTMEELRKIPQEKVKKNIAIWVEAGRKAKVKNLYLYLIDEAKGGLIAEQGKFALMIHEAGAKTWCAFNVGPGYKKLAGKSVDAAVYNSHPTREVAAAAHKDGGKIYSYDNPQMAVEYPETYRRNYGLLLWQNDFDGGFDFAWFWLFVNKNQKNPSHPWDDFDNAGYRDHCMMYPTVNGCVDTIQSEGCREGVDDCRYLATLQNAIAKSTNKNAAANASAWLKKLKDGEASALEDLDAVRSRMIEHIRACQKQ
ncbi:MAG: sugar-binding protein [Lentisphaerota bacterium]